MKNLVLCSYSADREMLICVAQVLGLLLSFDSDRGGGPCSRSCGAVASLSSCEK